MRVVKALSPLCLWAACGLLLFGIAGAWGVAAALALWRLARLWDRLPRRRRRCRRAARPLPAARAALK